MEALDASTGDIRLMGIALAVGFAFIIAFITPNLAGPRMRRLAREGPRPGIKPRRQWSVSGLSITLSLALPLLAFGGDSPEVRAAAVLVVLAGFTGMANDVLGFPRLLQAALAVGIAVVGASMGIRIEEVKPPFTTIPWR